MFLIKVICINEIRDKIHIKLIHFNYFVNLKVRYISLIFVVGYKSNYKSV